MEKESQFESYEFAFSGKSQESVTVTLNKHRPIWAVYLFSLIDKNSLLLVGFFFTCLASLRYNIPGIFCILFLFATLYLTSHFERLIELNEQILITEEEMQSIYQQVPWDKILSESRVDKTYWVNHVIKSLWKHIQPTIRQKVLNLRLNGFLQILDLNLGNEPLWVQDMYSSGTTRDNFLDTFIFDVELMYSSCPKMNLTLALFTKFITASISDVRLKAKSKIVVKYIKWFADEEYTVKEIVFSILEPPLIFHCVTHGLFKVFSFFGTFNDLLNVLVRQTVVYPYTIRIIFPELVKHTPRKPILKAPFGLITVDVIEADQLPSAITDLCKCRKPNPYCVVTIQKEKFQSHTVLSDESPWFNFKCSTYALSDFNFQVGIEICDNTYGKKTANFTGEVIANAWLDAKEHTEPRKNGQSCWVSLGKTERSQLHYRISCCELSTQADDLKESFKLACYGFPTGVVTVFVDSASGLTNFARQKEAILGHFNPYVTVKLGLISFDTPSSDQSHTPIWEQNLHFLVYNPNLQEILVQVMAKQASGETRAIGRTTIPIDSIFINNGNQVAVDKEYQLKGIVKNAFIRLVIMYQGAKVPTYFFNNYYRNTKVAEQELSKQTKLKKGKEFKISVEDKYKEDEYVLVKLKISWPKGNEIHVNVIDIQNLKIKVKLRAVYVVLHLRYKQYVLQVKRTNDFEAKSKIKVNEEIIFKAIDKNIRVYHLRVSLHTPRKDKYEFNKIAETYIKFPPLAPGPDFDESTYRLLITLPFKLMSKSPTEEIDYLNEDDDVLATNSKLGSVVKKVPVTGQTDDRRLSKTDEFKVNPAVSADTDNTKGKNVSPGSPTYSLAQAETPVPSPVTPQAVTPPPSSSSTPINTPSSMSSLLSPSSSPQAMSATQVINASNKQSKANSTLNG